MSRTASPRTLAFVAATGVGLTVCGVLAAGGAGHAETLAAKPLPVMVALQDRAPALPALDARDAHGTAARGSDIQGAAAQDRAGRVVRVVYPGPYAQR